MTLFLMYLEWNHCSAGLIIWHITWLFASLPPDPAWTFFDLVTRDDMSFWLPLISPLWLGWNHHLIWLFPSTCHFDYPPLQPTFFSKCPPTHPPNLAWTSIWPGPFTWHVLPTVIHSCSFTRFRLFFNLGHSLNMSPRLSPPSINTSLQLSPGFPFPMAPFRPTVLNPRGYHLLQQASMLHPVTLT